MKPVHATHQEHESSERRGLRLPRWHYLYFLLAGFDLVTVSFSLYVTHQLVGIHRTSVETNQLWAVRLRRYSEIGVLAAQVNAPGNNVFESGDYELERRHLTEALTGFNQSLSEAEEDLRTQVSAKIAGPLLVNLEKIDRPVQAMAEEARQIFSYFQADELDKAGAHMASMDHRFYEATGAADRLIQDVQEIQERLLTAQGDGAVRMRRFEYLIAGLIAFMVLGVTTYGIKISTAARKGQAERESLIQALRAKEGRLRSILDTAADGIIIIDERGIIESFNASAERLFGWSSEEVIGKNVSLLAPSPDDERHDGYIQRFLETHEPRIIGIGREVLARRRDDTTFPMHLSVSEVLLGDQRLFTGIVRDITEIKRAEETIRRHNEILEATVTARTAELTQINARLREEIAERERAVETQRESEARTRIILETAADGIITIDERGGVESFNAAAERIFGWDAKDIIGKNVDLLMPSPYSQEHNTYLARYLETGQRNIIGTGRELVGHRKNGTPFPVYLSVSEVRLHDRRLFTGIVQDITQRKQTEATLRESKERYRLLVEATHVIPWELDLATFRFTYVGPQAAEMLGYPVEDWLGEKFWENHLHPDDRDAAVQFCKSKALAGEDHEFEYRMLARDGEEIWVRDYVSVISNKRGPTQMRGVIINITAHKRAEEKMRRLACGLESAGESVSITDLNGTILYVNPAFTKLTGYTAEEMIGGNHRMLKSGQHPVELYEEMWAAILRGEVWSHEIVNRRKDGVEYDALLTTGPVRDRKGKLEGFVAIQRDITDRKRAAVALEQSNVELERKNKEMEQFVYTVSHDLKSPLVTIQGFAGHMARDMKEGRSDRIDGYLQRIHKSSIRMARLIDDLLDLSRIGRITQKLEPVSLSVLIREIEERHEEPLQVRQIALHVQEEMPTVLADKERISEVFDNLLTNAIKYGCNGEGARIEIGAVGEAGEIHIFVRDHGPGIPPEYHDTVFQLFHRLDQNAEGTGVGLSIVKRIVEVHGGRVWVESESGAGATFWVALPKKRSRIKDTVGA